LGGGIGVPRTSYASIAATCGVALVLLTVWLPAPISLTPAERAAIPPTALALGIALIVSALMVWYAGRPDHLRPALAVMGYALTVIAMPIVSGRLLAAVGEDRSAATLARVIQNVRPGVEDVEVVGVAAFPTSLPFYLRRTIPVATATGQELTSTFIADYQEQFRADSASPLRPADYWRARARDCRTPTVFVARADDARLRAQLDPLVPLYDRFGPDAVSRLEGMFGLAIWDENRRRLVLARDRAGEKPLFWTEVDGELRFASEIQALLEFPDQPRRLNRKALSLYHALG